MVCRCCKDNMLQFLFTTKVIGKDVSYFECKTCKFVQTEEPTWLSQAYSSTINVSDTGIMFRNLSDFSLTLATLCLMGEKKAILVDYAGGYGFLVRLLRDIGINAYWTDLYCENLVARGFEYKKEYGLAALVTAFEAFEHFVQPSYEMEKMLNIGSNILLTTSIIPQPVPNPSEWWYYGIEHGQHIGFYRIQTLEYLAKKFGLYLNSDGISIHLFSKKKYSLKLWNLYRRIANRIPRLFALGLKSKTWDDHLYVSKNLSSSSLKK